MPLGLALVTSALLSAGPSFDRVDLVSEDPGHWLNYELPNARAVPAMTLARWGEQVKAVWRLGDLPVYAGASLRSQSLVYERPLAWGLGLSAGVHTALLLPRGGLASLVWRRGPLRLALGVTATSGARWADPRWRHWDVLPTLGVGLGPGRW